MASGPNSRKQVTLLPPFLSDQAQKVQALGTFYLFCQATGELRGLSVHGCPLALPLLLAVPEVQLSVLIPGSTVNRATLLLGLPKGSSSLSP